MSIRSCCYKGCNNYTLNNIPNGSFTLFQFPKDSVRRKKWLMLGQVNPHIPPNALLMCSDHFDQRKYISINPRRTVLLGAAVPVPYCDKESSEENANVVQEEEKDNCTEQESTVVFLDHIEVTGLPENKELSEEQYPVESTIEDDIKEDHLYSYKDITIEGCGEEFEIERAYPEDTKVNQSKQGYRIITNYLKKDRYFAQMKKRKIMDPSITESESNPDRSRQNKSLNYKKSPSIDINETSKSKMNCVQETPYEEQEDLNISARDISNTGDIQDTLIDPQYVTTFIFKGEEYVQMSKEYFLREKSELLRKIEQYEDVLRSIGNHVNSLNLV